MNVKKIAILDYGIGNVKSITNAIESIGTKPILTRVRNEILSSDALILPGVGAFGQGMENLEKYGLVDVIYNFVETDKPFLGICLGMQMLMDESEEFGDFKGLGLIKGRVIKIPVKDILNGKLPHVSWNEIYEPQKDIWKNTILDRVKNKSDVYFVHSFVAQPINKQEVLSLTVYEGYEFCSSLHKDNIYGCQFHPEKSGGIGLYILKNFVGLDKERES